MSFLYRNTKFKQWIKQFPIYGKFGQDVSWNIGSLAVLGVSGIILNILIGRIYGAATLGVFNQVYAIYILLSQFAVGGMHLSVLKHISQFADNRQICNQIVSSAITITAIIGGIVVSIAFALHQWVGDILKSPDVAIGLIYVLPGLWCFALNKIFLSILNGYRLMKAYAFAQASRYILMIALLITCVITHKPSFILPIIFSGAEIILLIWLIIYTLTLRLYSPVAPQKWGKWFRKHILFGFKSFASGALSEINTRVDVLMLGFFTGDRIVGIYSFAAILVEGIIQLIIVIRTNINPVLTRLFTHNQFEKLKKTIHQGVKIFYPIMAGLGILCIITFPLLVHLFLPNSNFMDGWPVFCILIAGIMLSAGYMPFNMLLVQTGYPGSHTIMITLTVLANIVLNGLLIPWLGMYGAALATSASFVLAIVLLKIFVRHKLQMHI